MWPLGPSALTDSLIWQKIGLETSRWDMRDRLFTAAASFFLLVLLVACRGASSKIPPLPAELVHDPSIEVANLPPPAPAGDVKFDRLSLDQGLSQSTVTAILQDKKGFMWFGTLDGLNRFDGYSFRVFKHDSTDPTSIADNAISSLFEDGSGTLWVGTDAGGLNRFEPESETFVRYRHDPEDSTTISSDAVRAIVEDRDGDLWIGTVNGLNRLDRQVETFRLYRSRIGTDNPFYNTNNIRDLHVDLLGRLWIATSNGLLTFEPDHETFRLQSLTQMRDQAIPDGPQEFAVTTIFEDSSGRLWLGTDANGLIAYEPQTKRVTRYLNVMDDPDSLEYNSILAVEQDLGGNIWVGTQHGLDMLRPNSDSFVRFVRDPSQPDGLSDNEIRSLLVDEAGVLWIGTRIGGLSKFDPYKTKFAHIRSTGDPSTGLIHPQVLAFHQDDQGYLWIGTGGGLDRLDRESGQVTHYLHDADDQLSLSNDHVTSILEDRYGVLWIGTHGGLNRLNRNGSSFSRIQADPADPHSLSSDLVNAIFEDKEGYLWIGTAGGGLDRRDPSNGRFDHFAYVEGDRPPETLGLNYVLTFFQDDDDSLWVGTMGGLIRFDLQEESRIRYQHEGDDPSSLGHDLINDIHRDKSGRLWLATGAGLDLYDPASDAFSHIRQEDGLPNNTILGILEDSSGRLWLSSNGGLTRYDPSTGTVRNYDTNDGLQSLEFNQGANLQNVQDEMFFGGVNGFNVFRPDEIYDNPYRPPLVITDLRIFNESVPVGPNSILQEPIYQTDQIALTGQDTVFSLELAALHYGAPDENQYAYLMEGFDKAWNYVGNRRFATYTNLPPGNYIFRVIGSNSDGVWNEEGYSLEVVIPRPFWQSLWFIGLALVTILAAIFGYFRLRSRSMAARTQELEIQVARRTAEIERRRQIAEGLREILVLLNSKRSLEESLHYIVSQAARLTDAEDAIIFRLEAERDVVIVATNPGGQIRYSPDAELLAITEEWASERLSQQKPLIVPDLGRYWSDRPTTQDAMSTTHRAMLGIPLHLDEDIYGGLIMFYARERDFSEDDLELGRTFGDQAILAIANDMLRRQAEQMAVASERSRLARELHDAVTQTIFSASLLTETLEPIWEMDPTEGRKLLSELRQLTRGALAEMRTLLLELRPSALEESTLSNLLGQLAEAVTGRTGVPVVVRIEETRELPTTVRVALYRIAQESLNNVVKHARATQVSITLRDCCDGNGVILTVRDNGRGFESETVPAGRLGLSIIRERAQAVDARLAISSNPDQGTAIKVTWSGEPDSHAEAG